MAKTGHNSVDPEVVRSYADRIERVMGEVAMLKIDISELYKAAGQEGLNPKLLRQAIKERMTDEAVRKAKEEAMESYRIALGLLVGTPLGDAAMEKAS